MSSASGTLAGKRASAPRVNGNSNPSPPQPHTVMEEEGGRRGKRQSEGNSARSTKSLFRAISGQANRDPGALLVGVEDTQQARPEQPKRRALDLYPTGEPEAIRGLLSLDGERIRALGNVWEPAAGYGHLAREIEAVGIPCAVSDVANHGCPGVEVRSFYDYTEARAPAIITNPPYAEVSARDGHGRWLRHTLSLPNWRYCALLLSWDWPAARSNGLGALLDANPFSYCYLMRWKLDFTGEGSPPQRNAWFVWIRDWDQVPMQMRFMDRHLDSRQSEMFEAPSPIPAPAGDGT